MLSTVGKKFYLFWTILFLIFPFTINLLWIKSVFSSKTTEEARAIFVGYFPVLFEYISFVLFSSLFLSTLAFMFSMRLVREFDKYFIYGVLFLFISFYLLAFNMWNLI